MNIQLEKWYEETARSMENMIKSGLSDEEAAQQFAQMVEIIASLEKSCPDIKARYEGRKKIQESFSPEQIDFICYQIGDWYLDWEKKMWVDEKPNQHWLGTGKEQLKTMICGD